MDYFLVKTLQSFILVKNYFNKKSHQKNCLAILQYFLEKLPQLLISTIVHKKVQLVISCEYKFCHKMYIKRN